jgi:tripartite-type tricarboxylate transporter receptor subunit TctC
MMQRRTFTAASAILAAGAAGWAPATRAQRVPGFPQKGVTLLLPFPAATTPDLVTRILAEGLAAEFGQPIIVENRGGAGGIIGTVMASKAAPDGYTLLMGSVSTHAVNKTLYATLPYDPVKDFEPVVLVTKAPNMVLVGNDVPAHTLREFIAYAKARPGQLSFGSAGNGTSQHLAGEMFKAAAGVDILHVPYKGGAAALTDLRAGRIQVMFEVLPSALAQIKGGAIRALAVSSDHRVPVIADVPTAQEAGLDGYVVTTWHGFFVPAHTPQPVIAYLNASIAKVIDLPVYRPRVEALGFVIATGTPEAFREFIASESVKWSAIVKSSGAHAD